MCGTTSSLLEWKTTDELASDVDIDEEDPRDPGFGGCEIGKGGVDARLPSLLSMLTMQCGIYCEVHFTLLRSATCLFRVAYDDHTFLFTGT